MPIKNEWTEKIEELEEENKALWGMWESINGYINAFNQNSKLYEFLNEDMREVLSKIEKKYLGGND
jgi:hypothetical protein